ncbi:hypothetical protein niasHS_018094 [Heterodera schachtii]|uniref:Ubiquitin-like domain-containing protein n=1 Tax=Heterodera schachtii TaxID=97005 RepID=A0ABD2HQB2_HETSC
MSDGSEITVKWQDHLEFFVINVNGTDTVATVKQKIMAISEQRHKSELNGWIKLSKCDCIYVNALADEKTMREYGIGEGSTIHMEVFTWDDKRIDRLLSSASAAVPKGYIFHIHVEYGSARVTVWVKGTDTVEELKDKIRPNMEKDLKCKFGDISLIKRIPRADIEFADNAKTMNYYGIQEGDTIESLNARKLG